MIRPYAEQRASERYRYAADLTVSYFNSGRYFSARILNLCNDGMCFKSSLFLNPGTTIFIRLKKTHPNGICSGSFEGLRLATLAEIKWCSEPPGAKSRTYDVGVKYYNPVY